MRVLVLHPPVSIARDFVDYPYLADLGAVQLAAVLRAQGYDTALVDAYALSSATLFFPTPDARGHLGAPLAHILEACERGAPFDACVVAVTPFHRPPHRDELLAATLRGVRAIVGDAPIVLSDCYQSGQHYVEASSLLEPYPEADAWVKYEAEVTVPALLDALRDRGARPRGVHRGAQADLDALPPPAWDLVDLDARDRFSARVMRASGRSAWAFPIDGRTLPMVTSRGCPYTCVHCSSNPDLAPGEIKNQRRPSEATLRAHFDALARTHRATRVALLDEMINASARHFELALTLAEERGVRLDVPNGLRADHLRREHVARMRDRVTTLSVSAESGSQRVLDTIVEKKLDLTHIERVARDAHELGVPLMVHFIVGLPGETAADVNETLAYALDLYDRFRAEPAVQFSTPLPGTRLARGATLPIVSDWGPCFQTQPTQPGALVRPDELLAFKRTFDARLAASRGPEKLIVNLTYACNNHCTFCAVGTRTQVDGNLDRQKEFLDRYRERGVVMVDFDGGEPTLHPGLVEIVRYARAVGYERVNVTTNGRLLAHEPNAEKLVTSGLTTLLFSVHGASARSHSAQVGVAEAFEQTIGGIEACVRLAPSTLEIGMNVTLTKGNTAELPQIAELAIGLGLRWLNVQFLTPFGRATRWIAPDTEAAAKTTMRVIDTYGDRLRVQVINLPYCFMPGYEAHLEGDRSKLSRHMVFVNNEAVNLAAYLAERRVHKDVCKGCPHACFCGGFYELEDVPEPPWLVRAEDLLRPARALD